MQPVSRIVVPFEPSLELAFGLAFNEPPVLQMMRRLAEELDCVFQFYSDAQRRRIRKAVPCEIVFDIEPRSGFEHLQKRFTFLNFRRTR